MSELTIAAIGVGGVILGVALRPLAEDLYQRRKRSLLLEWTGPISAVGTSGEQGLQLTINGHSTNRVFVRDFRVKNRTGRTLRDFKLSMIYQPPKLDNTGGANVFIQTYMSDTVEKVPSWNQDKRQFDFQVDRFDRKGSFSGRVMASYRADLSLVTDGEIEVFESDRNSPFHPFRILITFGPLFLLIAVESLVEWSK